MRYRSLVQVALALSTAATLACSPAEQRDARDEARTAGREAAAGLENGAVTAAVKAKLIAEPTISGTRIDVDTQDGVVTLTGTVATAGARARAVELAKGTNGVRRVEDHLTVGP